MLGSTDFFFVLIAARSNCWPRLLVRFMIFHVPSRTGLSVYPTRSFSRAFEYLSKAEAYLSTEDSLPMTVALGMSLPLQATSINSKKN